LIPVRPIVFLTRFESAPESERIEEALASARVVRGSSHRCASAAAHYGTGPAVAVESTAARASVFQ
jgi:hypothetical protein